MPCTVEFEGRTWRNVGIRFKGNSSLSSTWGRGVYKLPFRLDFDELEDRFPEVAKQRFLGFKSLSLTNGFSDPSLIRDKVMADLFREGGVRAARTGFVRLYVDRGQGPEYFGLYSMAEVPGKAMLAGAVRQRRAATSTSPRGWAPSWPPSTRRRSRRRPTRTRPTSPTCSG